MVFQRSSIISLLLVIYIIFENTSLANPIWDYIKQYQVGVSFAPVTDSVRIQYETGDFNPPLIKREFLSQTDNGFRQCNGCGFFLQQAFKRKGNFYFTADVSLEIRALQMEREDSFLYADSPIKSASVSLYGGVIRPYIQFGLTPPKRLPDFLISLGPVYQILWGSTTINNVTHHTGAEGIPAGRKVGLTGYLELELVFLRFDDGAISLFSSRSNASDNDFQSNNFFPKEVDGMRNFAATFSRNSSGIKIVLNWP